MAVWYGDGLKGVFKDAIDCSAREDTIDVLVIEDQYIDRRGKSNPQAIMRLCQASGGVAGWLGFPKVQDSTWVRASIWKRGMPKPKPFRVEHYGVHHRNLALLHPHERKLYEKVLSAHRSQKVKSDLADAVGIGLWYLQRR